MIDVEALKAADRRELGRAITLLESTRSEHRAEAEALLLEIMPFTGNSVRIGITGVPGVGKSTFIEAFGDHVIAAGHRVAVLTVDPTSSISGGSILGDKTRMPQLAVNPHAFIRPSPAGTTLGGVARRTQESILVCEAAGFDVILVETVGVGQSETMVADMTDIFLLMLLPAAGDELQGIKRGVMELADLIVVNKSDGDLQKQASIAASDVQHVLNLIKRRLAQWQVPVLVTSAIENRGVDTVMQRIEDYRQLLESSGMLAERRRQQAANWLWNETREQLLAVLRDSDEVRAGLDRVLQQVSEGVLPASVAARKLVTTFLESRQ